MSSEVAATAETKRARESFMLVVDGGLVVGLGSRACWIVLDESLARVKQRWIVCRKEHKIYQIYFNGYDLGGNAANKQEPHSSDSTTNGSRDDPSLASRF